MILIISFTEFFIFFKTKIGRIIYVYISFLIAVFFIVQLVLFNTIQRGKKQKILWLSSIPFNQVEKDYLVEELKKLIEFKNTKIDIYINPHGEPLLYADIISLVNDISKIKNVNILSIITNGTLLTKELIDRLIKAGLNTINISINAIDQKIANKLAGSDYNVKHVLNMLYYMNNKIDLVITPVYLSGINDNEIIKLTEIHNKLRQENNKLLKEYTEKMVWYSINGRIKK